ncbi:unnamed protein product [Acanthoscelides obtectus]|uniref:Uncharacterized protein n=1 Tax=Acanthoscelides obtectus TaxID=200917 RepID=A0A9P0KEQ4_ACAOB|nr:unnamed protein product [Acanthoscelides obtectus]CAK1635057.1 hypothetical protein AOBTE_LOCUS9032 [Acanthoscelides obtectus]
MCSCLATTDIIRLIGSSHRKQKSERI